MRQVVLSAIVTREAQLPPRVFLLVDGIHAPLEASLPISLRRETSWPCCMLLDSVSGHDPTLTHVRPGCISISWCNFGPLDLMIWPNLQPHLRRDSFQARELGKVHSEPDDALANRSAHARNTASNRLLAGHITVRWQGCALPCTSTHSAFFPSHPEGKAPWLRLAGAVTIAAPGFPRPLVSWFCYS